MENQDKIFELIKKAAHNSETQDFPGMEKVWSRVEEKIDTKVLKTQNKIWKQVAVAASVLLVVSVAYQFLKEDKKNNQPKNELVIKDSIKTVLPESIIEENSIVNNETIEPVAKEADQILNHKTTSNPIIEKKSDSIITNPTVNAVVVNEDSKAKSISEKDDNTRRSGRFLKGQIYDAIVVRHQKNDGFNTNDDQSKETTQAKLKPLIVINGKVISSKDDNKSVKQELSELDEDLETVVELKEPLYIINGIHYSEQDLFGPNPTSPYAPLHKQEIKTIEILQDDEAVEKYGEKGKKGVVIITTQNGKPISMPKK
jgi:hypothetical protein